MLNPSHDPIADAFRSLIEDQKERLGVRWTFGPQVGPYSIIGLFNFRRVKGNGAVAMREACALADQLGVTLTLACGTERLFSWYEDLGFRTTHNFGHVRYFKRRPR